MPAAGTACAAGTAACLHANSAMSGALLHIRDRVADELRGVARLGAPGEHRGEAGQHGHAHAQLPCERVACDRGAAPIASPSHSPSATVYAPASADASSTPGRSLEPYTRSAGGALIRRRPSATTS